MTDLQRLVRSADFARVFDAEQVASAHAGQATTTLRLLKGLQSQAQGGAHRPTAEERIARKHNIASGRAPREMTGVMRDGCSQ